MSANDKLEKGNGLDPVKSNIEGEIHDDPNFATHDAVFGNLSEGPNYRNVNWLGTVALMMKTQIGLDVLSIPAVFDVLGLIPGIICLLVIAGITTWSAYMVGVFKLLHPEVYSIDDVGALIFGKIGRIIFGTAFTLYWIFVAGSVHGTCTAVFLAVAAIAGFCLGSIQTLGRISWLAWVGLTGILTSIIALTISVGVQSRPAAGTWVSDFKLFGSPTFTEAVAACSSLVFAYAVTPAFFSIVSEMRDPKHYTRSLLICQGGVTITYITIGTVVYYFCGSYVASPALGSAGAVMKRVCYGLALPGLLVTTTLFIHIAAKYIFVRALHGSRHLASNTVQHWITWIGCTFGIALIAYIIASAIPVFGGLVSLIGALLGTLLSFQPMGFMWLYDNFKTFKLQRTPKLTWMVCFSIFVIVSGTFLMVAGTYSSIFGIIDDTSGSGAWSCADNSNSV